MNSHCNNSLHQPHTPLTQSLFPFLISAISLIRQLIILASLLAGFLTIVTSQAKCRETACRGHVHRVRSLLTHIIISLLHNTTTTRQYHNNRSLTMGLSNASLQIPGHCTVSVTSITQYASLLTVINNNFFTSANNWSVTHHQSASGSHNTRLNNVIRMLNVVTGSGSGISHWPLLGFPHWGSPHSGAQASPSHRMSGSVTGASPHQVRPLGANK